MKVRYEKKEEPLDRMAVKDIPIGTVFSGTISYVEGVYAKTYDRIVDMKRLHRTWDLPPDEVNGKRGSDLGVNFINNYKELDVELLVKGEK